MTKPIVMIGDFEITNRLSMNTSPKIFLLKTRIGEDVIGSPFVFSLSEEGALGGGFCPQSLPLSSFSSLSFIFPFKHTPWSLALVFDCPAVSTYFPMAPGLLRVPALTARWAGT